VTPKITVRVSTESRDIVMRFVHYFDMSRGCRAAQKNLEGEIPFASDVATATAASGAFFCLYENQNR
jgi:hypothetical protein